MGLVDDVNDLLNTLIDLYDKEVPLKSKLFKEKYQQLRTLIETHSSKIDNDKLIAKLCRTLQGLNYQDIKFIDYLHKNSYCVLTKKKELIKELHISCWVSIGLFSKSYQQEIILLEEFNEGRGQMVLIMLSPNIIKEYKNNGDH